MRTMRLVIIPLLLAALLLAGCQSYHVSVLIRPDGSGERASTVERNGALDASEQALLTLVADRGWTETREARGGNLPDRHVFLRVQTVPARGNWAPVAGDILVLAAEGSPVRLQNRVAVDWFEMPDGRRCRYRETLAWVGLQAVISDLVAERFDAGLAQELPVLDPAERAQIVGLLRGTVLLGWDELTEAEGHDGGPERLLGWFVTEAQRLMPPNTTSEDRDRLAQVAREIFTDEEGSQGDDLLEALPGLGLAVGSSLELRVELPGTVVYSNADRVEGTTAIWDLELGDTVHRDLVLEAEARIEAGS